MKTQNNRSHRAKLSKIRARKRRCHHKKKKDSTESISKYFYPLYIGWTNDDTPLFRYACDAIIWQISFLYKDGFTDYFSTCLPPTFCALGVVEYYSDVPDEHKPVLVNDIADLIQISNQSISEKMINFLSGIQAFTVSHQDFRVTSCYHQTYISLFKRTSFDYIESKFFHHPDYYRSSNSIFPSTSFKKSYLEKSGKDGTVPLDNTIYVPKVKNKSNMLYSIGHELEK